MFRLALNIPHLFFNGKKNLAQPISRKVTHSDINWYNHEDFTFKFHNHSAPLLVDFYRVDRTRYTLKMFLLSQLLNVKWNSNKKLSWSPLNPTFWWRFKFQPSNSIISLLLTSLTRRTQQHHLMKVQALKASFLGSSRFFQRLIETLDFSGLLDSPKTLRRMTLISVTVLVAWFSDRTRSNVSPTLTWI